MSGRQTPVVNAVVENPVNAALDALKSGQDPELAVYGKSGTINPTPDEVDTETSAESEPSFNPEDEGSWLSGESQESSEAESEESEKPEEITDEPSQPQKKQAADIEEIIISDEEGRKKVKVDWSDREKLKKYVQMAAGMRKFQAERDRLQAELKNSQPRLQELESSWKAIEQAYQQEGIRGLVNLLSNRPDGYDQWITQEYQRRKERENASPAQIEKMDLEEKLATERRAREQLAKKVEDDMKRAEAEREQAAQKALEAKLHPAFDKYRFAGKLGDRAVEDQYDRAIWNLAISRLEEIPDTVELTSQLVEKEFRTVAMNFRKMINQQAEKKATAVVNQKKVAAQEKVATSAVNGMRNSGAADAFKSDIKKGDFTSALRSVLTGKVRL